MNTYVNEIWEKALEILKAELTEVSFNTWIKSIDPLKMTDSTITLGVRNDFTKDILENRYKDLIKNSIQAACNKSYSINFVISSEEASDLDTSTSKHTNSKHNLIVNDEMSAILNPKYTFDSFVIGNSNRFAHAASLAVAESPAKAYNPLFIYGGVGLGKTHLMHAIGSYIQTVNSKSKVVYVSSEKFTNELINSIKDDKNVEFRNKYRNVDVLLIDDIQFIAGKESTQEEFFHTFNALHDANKQIILSSDRPPKEIPTLEDRLRSRFEWGLTNKDISIDLASEALKDIISNRNSRQVTIELIQDIVSSYYNLKVDDFKSARRTRNVAFPRQIAMYLSRKLTDTSLPKIGEEFGGRDHTTVIHAYEKISQNLKKDESLQSAIAELSKRINQK